MSRSLRCFVLAGAAWLSACSTIGPVSPTLGPPPGFLRDRPAAVSVSALRATVVGGQEANAFSFAAAVQPIPDLVISGEGSGFYDRSNGVLRLLKALRSPGRNDWLFDVELGLGAGVGAPDSATPFALGAFVGVGAAWEAVPDVFSWYFRTRFELVTRTDLDAWLWPRLGTGMALAFDRFRLFGLVEGGAAISLGRGLRTAAFAAELGAGWVF